MATKEQDRRARIEAEYTPPAPLISQRQPTPEERPTSAAAMVRLGRSKGFIVRELYSLGSLYPSWKKTDPDDVLLSYVTPLSHTYRVAGLISSLPLTSVEANTEHLRRLPPEALVMWEGVWSNGRASYGRWKLAAGPWHVSGVTALTAALKVV